MVVPPLFDYHNHLYSRKDIISVVAVAAAAAPAAVPVDRVASGCIAAAVRIVSVMWCS